jgi:hypothetical protein
MAIELKYSNPKFPKALFEKVAKCFPIIRHGKILHCIFEDDMQLKQPHVRLMAHWEILWEHYMKQGWTFDFGDTFTQKGAVRILRQALSVYHLKLQRTQTTMYGIPKRYYSVLKEDQTIEQPSPRTIAVERKGYSICFC